MKAWVITSMLALLPSFWFVMGWLGGRRSEQPLTKDAPSITFWVSSVMLGAMLVVAVLLALGVLPSPVDAVFKLHALNSVVLLLVLFIGLILISYSRNYMAGEECYRRFFRWMMLSFTAVTITVLANHLIVFWFGWMTISLCLHRLLTLYPERPKAILAAHKKFLLARVAELCVLSAFGLLYLDTGSLYIDQVLAVISERNQQAVAASQLQVSAAVLLSIAALIKCAQLPVHGWLVKVVEAPTPVSALLHAGIINLGGYLLILFAPLISSVGAAQWLLLIVAGISTVLAALIMTTRISVKVRLAWSTSSQMGLMLIECALGLYELALVHLVTHSMYKAFAFLYSGNTVYEYLEQQLVDPKTLSLGHWIVASAVPALGITGMIWVTNWQGPMSPWVLLGLGITLYLIERPMAVSFSQRLLGSFVALALVGCYAMLKFASAAWLFDGKILMSTAFSAMDIWIISLFVLLFLLSAALRHGARFTWVQSLSRAMFAGLYLDEWFTRVTLRVWPVVLPETKRTPRHNPTSLTQLEKLS